MTEVGVAAVHPVAVALRPPAVLLLPRLRAAEVRSAPLPPVAVKAFETASHYVDAIFGCGVGGLIHAAVGSFGGCGGVPNRFGLAA